MTREFPQVTMPEASQYLIRYSPDAKNSIEEINHLYRRLFKELYRISGEQVDINTQYFLLGCDLTHEDLLYILKDLRAVYKGDFTMDELITWIEKRTWIL